MRMNVCRLAAAVAFLALAGFACRHIKPEDSAPRNPAVKNIPGRTDIDANASRMIDEGRHVFRHDTFGSEDFWGTALRLHEPIAGAERGGAGPGLTPHQALQLGLKVDSDAVPKVLLQVLKGGSVSLDKEKTTLELLKADAVVGVKGFFDDPKDGMRLTRVGITCALCHSTVDDSFVKGIGQRLDGWPNRDLDVGAIIALAPSLAPFEKELQLDDATIRKVLKSWGPGRYDAELNQDGKAFRPDGKTASTVLPAAFGLAGVNLHTYSGWGSVTHWNAYVAITQMHGKGTFYDPRLDDAAQFPVAARARHGNVRNTPDLVTSKLAALHFYQLAIPAPKPKPSTYDAAAAQRGSAVFSGKAQCARCHVPPLYTEPGWPMHTAAEMGIDDFHASRSPDRKFYRTTPLKGLFVREKGGFYHDGRFATYEDVIAHYDALLRLQLSPAEKTDLVQFLKSL
jgi:hypothetical protein